MLLSQQLDHLIISQSSTNIYSLNAMLGKSTVIVSIKGYGESGIPLAAAEDIPAHDTIAEVQRE